MTDKLPTVYRRYNYRINPNLSAKQYLNQAIGNSRAMYNILLHQTKSEYELHKTNPEIYPKPGVSHFDLSLRIKTIRSNPDTPWFQNTPHNCFTPIANNLSLAYNTFFRNIAKGKDIGYPVFKKKTSGGSVAFPNNDRFKIIGIENRSYLELEGLWLPKVDGKPKVRNRIRIVMNRPLPSEAKSLSIKRTPSGKYYVSFLVEVQTTLDASRHKIEGVDVGLSNFVASYDGERVLKINPLKAFRKSEEALAKCQRAYARKYEANKCRKTGKARHTKNMDKERRKIAKRHERIAHQRDYFVKYTISQMMKEVKCVVIEDLHAKGMLSNHKLAKSVSDAAFGKFKQTLLAYCEKHNVEVRIASRYFPSTQICNNCGNRNDIKVKIGVQSWVCQHCSAENDRDGNAAMNLYDLAFLPYGTSYIKNITLHLRCVEHDSAIQSQFSNRLTV